MPLSQRTEAVSERVYIRIHVREKLLMELFTRGLLALALGHGIPLIYWRNRHPLLVFFTNVTVFHLPHQHS
jgi:hypothetical protein